MINNESFLSVYFFVNKYIKYIEKQIIMDVQATPKTHPGGVQGAFSKPMYQKDCGPLFMSQLPNPKPLKLIARNKIETQNKN